MGMEEGKQLDDRYARLVEPNLGYIGNMLRWGASIEKVCSRIGVASSELMAWSETRPELSEVFKAALMQRDEDIQRAFFESAVGGFHTEVSESLKQLPDGSKILERREVTKWKGADAKLMALMLRNTDPTYVDKDSFDRRLEERAMALREEMARKAAWLPPSEVRKSKLVSDAPGEPFRRKRAK